MNESHNSETSVGSLPDFLQPSYQIPLLCCLGDKRGFAKTVAVLSSSRDYCGLCNVQQWGLMICRVEMNTLVLRPPFRLVDPPVRIATVTTPNVSINTIALSYSTTKGYTKN